VNNDIIGVQFPLVYRSGDILCPGTGSVLNVPSLGKAGTGFSHEPKYVLTGSDRQELLYEKPGIREYFLTRT
jgi:hypothetical protein